MKKYNTPEIEIVDLADVIVTSIETGDAGKDEGTILQPGDRNDWWRK